ncbi:MAG: c-type cytochrome, partial [Alphaproteobacteria bacterium]
IWSGIYNVSASRDHLDATTWLLDIVRRQSVRTHSMAIRVPPLEDPAAVRLGAVHYDLACAGCHGAPGRRPGPLAPAMLPTPPPLDRAIADWQPEQLFWIILNGQKYTAMPAWLESRRADEVWAVVAFLRHLPTLDAAGYRRLARLPPDADTSAPDPSRSPNEASCRRCHDPPAEIADGSLVPPLERQTPQYLSRTLSEYAAGTRPSGIMQFVAATLDRQAIERLSHEFAASAEAAADPTGAAVAARGRRLVHEGIPERGIPACISCHSPAADARFPRLAGLPVRYLEQQLRLWREGARGGTPFSEIMRPIAVRLEPGEAAEAAAYLATVRPEATARAVAP